MWCVLYLYSRPFVLTSKRRIFSYSITAFFFCLPKIKRIGVEFWPVDREQIVCELQSLSSLHIPAGVLCCVSEKEKCYSYLELDSCFLFEMIHM